MIPRQLAVRWVTVVALAALLIDSPNAVSAPGHGGGGHGGGRGHGVVGFHGGGFHPGGFHGRYFNGGWRGYHSGFWGYGYPWWYGYGFGLGVGLGYGYPYYPAGYPVYIDPGYYGPAGCAAPPPPPPAGPAPAAGGGLVQVSAGDVLFSIRVPANADVWINGEKTTQSGPQREFLSSGLAPGRTYTFTIRARWAVPDGTTVQLERRVSVQGGERRTVDFLMPASNALRN